MTASFGAPIIRPLRLQAQYREGQPRLERLREAALNAARTAAGVFCRPPDGRDWILFQFYHWVLDDEREAFRRQLKTLQCYGDFISLDEAIAQMRSPAGIRGRQFCVTFDDGFRHCYTNAAPVLKELGIPAAFFLPTRYIGLALPNDWGQIAPFYQHAWTRQKYYFEFLNWDECRELAARGFTIGSHTHTHARLASVSLSEAESELRLSKQVIEEQIGIPCRHFCCPWGKSRRDFDPSVHPQMASTLGYDSFLTTDYGVNRKGDSPLFIRRIGSIPAQGPLRLRYSLFGSWIHSARSISDRQSMGRRVR